RPVAEVGQFSNLPGVSYEDLFSHITTRANVRDGNGRIIPLFFLATNAGYKIHCPQIPGKSSLKIIMAIASIKEPIFHAGTGSLMLGKDDKPEDVSVLETIRDPKIDDGIFRYWFGATTNDRLYLSPEKAERVLLRGSYTANYRRRGISETLIVPNGNTR